MTVRTTYLQPVEGSSEHILGLLLPLVGQRLHASHPQAKESLHSFLWLSLMVLCAMCCVFLHSFFISHIKTVHLFSVFSSRTLLLKQLPFE